MEIINEIGRKDDVQNHPFGYFCLENQFKKKNIK